MYKIRVIKMSITKKIAEYSVETKFEKLPKEVVEKAKFLIADNIGCAIRGPSNKFGRTVVELAKELGGTPESTIFGTEFRTNSVQAAFVNSTLANSMDYDDIGQVGHPGSTIVPAALATAERVGASGKDLITAVIMGYEVCERVGLACKATPERYRQVHGLGTHQVFGAVTAVGKILDLDVEGMLNAFGIAGPWAAMPHSGKFGNPLEEGRQISFVKDNVSRPAQAGLSAALLAKKGWIGNKSILDGEKGFWIMSGSDRFRPDILTKLDDFKILTVSYKPYPACRWPHTSLDAMTDLIREHMIEPSDIEKAVVNTIRPMALSFGNPSPANIVDAVFSMPYPITMVIYGLPRSQWYLDGNLKDPQYLEMAAKVETKFDPEAQTKYENQPTVADFVPTTVEVTTKGNEKYQKYREVPRGTPMNPLSHEEIRDKFLDLTAEVLGPERSEGLYYKIINLEEVDDYSKLAEIMRVIDN